MAGDLTYAFRPHHGTDLRNKGLAALVGETERTQPSRAGLLYKSVYETSLNLSLNENATPQSVWDKVGGRSGIH